MIAIFIIYKYIYIYIYIYMYLNYDTSITELFILHMFKDHWKIDYLKIHFLWLLSVNDLKTDSISYSESLQK